MWTLFKIFEKFYKLSSQTLECKILPKREREQPFKTVKSFPQGGWWSIYNGLKHDMGFTLRDANLMNTRDALACAFLLNVVHEPSMIRLYDYEVLKSYSVTMGKPTVSGPMRASIPRNQFIDMIHNKSGFWGSIETFLFRFDYNQYEGIQE